MKKFLLGIVIFFTVMVAADYVFGKVMFYAESQSSSKNYHCMYEATEDILILGSSFAVRNLVPSVIEDSLDISCYNAGEAGNGAMVAWARYNMFIKNHTPKLILYTLTPDFDYVKSDDYSKYLNTVKPYYGYEESVTSMYNDVMIWSDCVILNSNFVRFNSYGARLIYYWITKKHMGLKGYEPLYEIFTPYETEKEQENKTFELDLLKMNYLDMLFADATKREIPILCVLPPIFNENVSLYRYKEGFLLCEKYGIPVINHKYFEGITMNAQYFYDIGHLNDKGAKLYSSKICGDIQAMLNKEIKSAIK